MSAEPPCSGGLPERRERVGGSAPGARRMSPASGGHAGAPVDYPSTTDGQTCPRWVPIRRPWRVADVMTPTLGQLIDGLTANRAARPSGGTGRDTSDVARRGDWPTGRTTCSAIPPSAVHGPPDRVLDERLGARSPARGRRRCGRSAAARARGAEHRASGGERARRRLAPRSAGPQERRRARSAQRGRHGRLRLLVVATPAWHRHPGRAWQCTSAPRWPRRRRPSVAISPSRPTTILTTLPDAATPRLTWCAGGTAPLMVAARGVDVGSPIGAGRTP